MPDLARPLIEEMKRTGDAIHASLKKTKPYQLIQTYGKGLNREELESFLTRETVQTFSFYHEEAKGTSKSKSAEGGFDRFLTISKNLFLSFLLKLTPARRLFYAIALVLFVWGLFEVEWWWKVGTAFVILNVLLAMELADKLLTKNELEVARAIQSSLQPEDRPRLEHLTIASHFQPASDVGGDYYDFFQAGDERLTLILGDVSGKGMPAALYAMKLQGLFELLGRTEASPKEMLVEMNDVFSERIRRNYFITALVGLMDFKENKLALARAGHNLPLYFHAATGRTTWLNPKGLGIGMAENGVFSGLMEEMTIPLTEGDVILFYTDGVSEAMNRRDEVFGYRRLEEILTRSAHLGAEEIKEGVLRDLRQFTRGVPFSDDVTLVVTKVK
jgi:sigma-B regulation protein RsbU (phosphoserine phosphatase)